MEVINSIADHINTMDDEGKHAHNECTYPLEIDLEATHDAMAEIDIHFDYEVEIKAVTLYYDGYESEFTEEQIKQLIKLI